MKRESVLMLIAGIFLGAVLSFMATREYYRNAPSKTVSPGHMETPAAQNGEAQTSFDPQQHQQQLEKMKAYLDEHPGDIKERRRIADIFYDVGNYSEAIPLYEEVLKKQPRNTDVMVDLGSCYRKVGRADVALAKFNEALKINPDKKQALFNKVVVLWLDKHDLNGARNILEKLKKQYPDEPAVKDLSEAINKEADH